ncbi:DUF5776 domain-containing protein [Apilactobacillus kunkeei]|uniref:DUF5776 domain-containing protein n=3 Tax=Lactobacillales TaxID=186826 RepID=A0A1L8CGK7_9LACO|nr:DUF5776 domain-containing protein [Apilactobacillus kunkeei]GAT90337.1 hypothetical protein FF306_00435 [Apilactobacillus kunkeei]
MQYNKNEFQKTNDKKILRKVKKQWVVVSLASFAFLGGTSLALMSQGVSAHADDTTKNNTEVVQPNNNQQSSNQQSDDNKQTASNNDQQNQNDANKDNGQSTNNNDNQKQNDNSDNKLSNRLGATDQSNNQNQTTDIVNNQSANDADNYQKHLQGNAKDSNDANKQYTQSINQGVNDAYSNRKADNDDITDNNSKELYSAAYEGVNADQSKSVSDNMASSSIDDIKKAAANTSSMLYIAYKYGVDFRKTADAAFNDATTSGSDNYTQGSNRPSADSGLQSMYDNSYMGVRNALNQQFDSKDKFNVSGYDAKPDDKNVPENNTDTSAAQYKTAFNKMVNDFNNGIVYANNNNQFNSAMIASGTNSIQKIVLTNNINSSGTVTNLGNLVIDGQNKFSLSGTYTFNKSDSGSVVKIQNVTSLANPYVVNGNGFVEYDNVRYNDTFDNLFNSNNGNGNYVLGANVYASDATTNNGVITYAETYKNLNPSGGKFVVGENGQYAFNSLMANYIVFQENANVNLSPVEIDNYVYQKSWGKTVKTNYIDSTMMPSYGIVANNNINVHKGAKVNITLSNNTNGIRVGNINNPADTGSGDSGNIVIKGTVNLVVPDGVTPTALNSNLVNGPNNTSSVASGWNNKRADAVVWLGHGMQILSGGAFNVDAKIPTTANAGLYNAFIYGPYSTMTTGGRRNQSSSKILVLQNGTLNVNMNTGSKDHPIRVAFLPIVAFNPKKFNLTLNVTPGSSMGAAGPKLSLSSIDVFGAILDQENIASIKTNSGYLLNPYIYHYRRNGTALGENDDSFNSSEIFQDINGTTNGYKPSGSDSSKKRFSFSYPYTWGEVPDTGVNVNGVSFDQAFNYLQYFVQLYEDIIASKQDYSDQVLNGNIVNPDPNRSGAYNPEKAKNGDNPTQAEINTAIANVWKNDVNRAINSTYYLNDTNNKNALNTQKSYLSGSTFADLAGMSKRELANKLKNINDPDLPNIIINIAKALGQTVAGMSDNQNVVKRINEAFNGNTPKVISGQNARNDTSIDFSGSPSIEFNHNIQTYQDANGHYHAKFEATLNNPGDNAKEHQVEVHYVTGSFDAKSNNGDVYRNMYKVNNNNETLAQTITLDSSNSTTLSDGSIRFNGDIDLGTKPIDTVGIRLNTFMQTGLADWQGPAYQPIASVSSSLRPGNNSYQTNVEGFNSVWTRLDNGQELKLKGNYGSDNDMHSIAAMPTAQGFLKNISGILNHLSDRDTNEAQYYTNKTSSDPLPSPEYREYLINNQNITPFDDSSYSGADANNKETSFATIRVIASNGDKTRLVGITKMPVDAILNNGSYDTSNYQAKTAFTKLASDVSNNNKGYTLDLSQTPMKQYDKSTYDIYVPDVQFIQDGSLLPIDTPSGTKIPFKGIAKIDKSNGNVIAITPQLPGFAVSANNSGLNTDSYGMYTVQPAVGTATVYIDDDNGNPTGLTASVQVKGNSDGTVNAVQPVNVSSGKNDGLQYTIDNKTKIGIVTDAKGNPTYHVQLTGNSDKKFVNVVTPSGSKVDQGGYRRQDADGSLHTVTYLPGFDSSSNTQTTGTGANQKDVVKPSANPVSIKIPVYQPGTTTQLMVNNKPVYIEASAQGQNDGTSKITDIKGRGIYKTDDGNKYKVSVGDNVKAYTDNSGNVIVYAEGQVDNDVVTKTPAITPDGVSVDGGATVINSDGTLTIKPGMPGFDGSNPGQMKGNSAVVTPSASPVRITVPVISSVDGSHVGVIQVDVQGNNDGHSYVVSVDNPSDFRDSNGNKYTVKKGDVLTPQYNAGKVTASIVAKPEPVADYSVEGVTDKGNDVIAGATIKTKDGVKTSISNMPGFDGSTPANMDATGSAILTPSKSPVQTTINVLDANTGDNIGTMTVHVQGNSDGNSYITSIDSPSNATLTNGHNGYTVTTGTAIAPDMSKQGEFNVYVTPSYVGTEQVNAVTDSGNSIKGGATISANASGGKQATANMPGFAPSPNAQFDGNGDAILEPVTAPVETNVDIIDQDSGQKVGSATVMVQGNEDGTSRITSVVNGGFVGMQDASGKHISYTVTAGSAIDLNKDSQGNYTPIINVAKKEFNYNTGDKVPIQREDGTILPFSGTISYDKDGHMVVTPDLPGYNSQQNDKDTTFNVTTNNTPQAVNVHIYNALTGQDTNKVVNVLITGHNDPRKQDKKPVYIDITALSDQQSDGVVADSTDTTKPIAKITDSDGNKYTINNVLTANKDVLVHVASNSNDSDYYYLSLLPDGTPVDQQTVDVVTANGSSVGKGTYNANAGNGKPFVTPDNPGFTSSTAKKYNGQDKYIVTPTTSQTNISVTDGNGNVINKSVSVTVSGDANGNTTITKVPNNGVVTGSDGNTYQINSGQTIQPNTPNTIGGGYNTTGQLIGMGNVAVTSDGQKTNSTISNLPVNTDADGSQVVAKNTTSADGSYIISAGSVVSTNGQNQPSVDGLPYNPTDQTVTINNVHFMYKDKDTGLTGTIKGIVGPDGKIKVVNDTTLVGNNNDAYTAKANTIVEKTVNNGVTEYHVQTVGHKIRKDVPAIAGANGPVINNGATVTYDPKTGVKTVTSNVAGFGLDNGQKSEEIPANTSTSQFKLTPIKETINGVHNDQNGKDTGSITDQLQVQGHDDGSVTVISNTSSKDGKYVVPAGAKVTKNADGTYHAESLSRNPDGTVTINNASYDGTNGTSVVKPVVAHLNDDGSLTVKSDTAVEDGKGNVYVAKKGSKITPVVNPDGSTTYHIASQVQQQDQVVPAKAGKNGGTIQGGAIIHTNPDGTKTIKSNVPGFTGNDNVSSDTDTSLPVLTPGITTLPTTHADDVNSKDTGKVITNMSVQGHDDGSVTVVKNTKTDDGANVAMANSPVTINTDGSYHVQTLPIDKNGNVMINEATITDENGKKLNSQPIYAKLNDDGSLTLNQPSDGGVHTITQDGYAYQANNGTPVIKTGNGYQVKSEDDTARITNATLIDEKGNKVDGTALINVDKSTGKTLPSSDLSNVATLGGNHEGYHISNPDTQTVDWGDGKGNVNTNASVKVVENYPYDFISDVKFKNSYTGEVFTDGSKTYQLKVTHSDGMPINYGTKDAAKAINELPDNYVYDAGKNIIVNKNNDGSFEYVIPVVPTKAELPTAIIDGKDNQEKAITKLPVNTNEDGTITTSKDHVAKGMNDDPNYYFVPKGSNVRQEADGTYHADGYTIPANPDGTFDITKGQYDKDENTSYPGKITANIDPNTGKITIAKASVTKAPDGTIYQVDEGETVNPKYENGDVQYHVAAHAVAETQNIPAKAGANSQRIDNAATVTINPDNGTKTIASNIPGFAGQSNVPVDQDTGNVVLTPTNDVIKGVHFNDDGKDTGSTGNVPVKGNQNGDIVVTKNTKSTDGKYMIPAGSTVTKGTDGNYHGDSFPVNPDGTINIPNGSYDASDKTSQTGKLIAKVDDNGNMTVAKGSVTKDEKGHVYIAHSNTPITKSVDQDGNVTYHVNAEKVAQNQSISAKTGQNGTITDGAAKIHVNDDGSKTVVSNVPGFKGYDIPEGQPVPNPVVLTPSAQNINGVHMDDINGNDTGETADNLPVIGQDDGSIKTTKSITTPDGKIILANTKVTKDKDGNWHAQSYPYDAGNRQVTLSQLPIKDDKGNVIDHQDVVANVDLANGTLSVANPQGVHATTSTDAYQADAGNPIVSDNNHLYVNTYNDTAVIHNATLIDVNNNANVGSGMVRVDKTTGNVLIADLPSTGGNQNAGFHVYDPTGQTVQWSDETGNVNDNAIVRVTDNAPYHANNHVKFINIYNNQVFTDNTNNPSVKVNDDDLLPIFAGGSNAAQAVTGIPSGYSYAKGKQIIVQQTNNDDDSDKDKRTYIVPVVPAQGEITNASVLDQKGDIKVDHSQSLPVVTNDDGSINTTKDVIAKGKDGNYYVITKNTSVVPNSSGDGSYTAQGSKWTTNPDGTVNIDNAHLDDKADPSKSVISDVSANIDPSNGTMTVNKTTVVTDPTDSTKAYQVNPGDPITITKDANGEPEYHIPATIIEQDKKVNAQVGQNGSVQDGAATIHVNKDGSKTVISNVPGFTGDTIPNDEPLPTNPVLKPTTGTIDNVHILDNDGKDTGSAIDKLPIQGQSDGTIKVTQPVTTPNGRIILPGSEVIKDSNGNWTVPSYPYDAGTRQVTLPNVAVKDEKGNVIGVRDVHANIDLNKGTMTLADDQGIHIVKGKQAYQANAGTEINNDNGSYSLNAKDDTAVINNATLIDNNNGAPKGNGKVVIDKTTGHVLDANLPSGGYENNGYHVYQPSTQVVDWMDNNGNVDPNAKVVIADNSPYSARQNVQFIDIYTNKPVSADTTKYFIYANDKDNTPIYAGSADAYKAVSAIPDGYKYATGRQIQVVADPTNPAKSLYQVPIYPSKGEIDNASVYDQAGSVQVDHGQKLPVTTDDNGNITTSDNVIAKGKDGNYYIIPSGSNVNMNPGDNSYEAVGNKLPSPSDGIVNIANAHYDDKDDKTKSVIGPVTAKVDPDKGTMTVDKTAVVTDPNDPTKAYQVNAGDSITIKPDGKGGVEYHMDATPIDQDKTIDAQLGDNGKTQPNGAKVHYNSDGTKDIVSNVPGYTGQTELPNDADTSQAKLTPVNDVAHDVSFDTDKKATGSTGDVPVKGDDKGNIIVTQNTKSTDGKYMIPKGSNIIKGDDGKYHGDSLPINEDGTVTVNNANVNDSKGDNKAHKDLVANVDDQGNITTAKDKVARGDDGYDYIIPAGSPVTKNETTGQYQVNGSPLPIKDGQVTIDNAHYDDKLEPGKGVINSIVANIDDNTGKLTVSKDTVVPDPSDPGRVYKATAGEPITIKSDGKGGVEYHIDATPIIQDEKVPAQPGKNGKVQPGAATIHYNSDGTKDVISNVPGFTGQTNVPASQDTTKPVLTPTQGTASDVHFDSDGKDTGAKADLPVKGDDDGNVVVTKTTKSTDGKHVIPAGTVIIKNDDGTYHGDSLSIDENGNVNIKNANVVDTNGHIQAQTDLPAKIDDDGNIATTKTKLIKGNDGNYYMVPAGSTVTKNKDTGAYQVNGNKIPANADGTLNIDNAFFDDKNDNTKSVIGPVTAKVDPNTGDLTVAKTSVVTDPTIPHHAYQADAGEPITIEVDKNNNVSYHVAATLIQQDEQEPAQPGEKAKSIDDAATIHINRDGSETIESNIPGYSGTTIPEGQTVPSNPVLSPVNDEINHVHFNHGGQYTQSIGNIPVKGDGDGLIIVTKPTRSSDNKYLVPAGATVNKNQDGSYHVESFPINADGTITIDNAHLDASDNTYVIGKVFAKLDGNGNLIVQHKSVVNNGDGYNYTANENTIIKVVINGDGTTAMHVVAVKTRAGESPESAGISRAAKLLPVENLKHKDADYVSRYMKAYKAELKRRAPSYVYSVKGLYLHSSTHFTIKNRVKGYAKKPRRLAHVFKVRGVVLDHNKYPRLKVNGGYIYFNKNIRDAYYRTNHPLFRVIRKTGVLVHTDKKFHYGKRRVIRLRHGALIHVKKVVKYYSITRLYIGNGQYVTSNKTYVALAKKKRAPLYVYWTNKRGVYVNTHFTRKNAVKYFTKRPRNKANAYKVLRIVKTKNGTKYRIKHGYINAKGTIPAYYVRRTKLIRVIRNRGILVHNAKKFTKRNAVKHFRKNALIRVQSVARFYGITRFYIGHGEYITSNKTWVKTNK